MQATSTKEQTQPQATALPVFTKFTIKSIVVDTVNSIQDNELIKDTAKKGKLGHDEWRDYGIDLSMFINNLQNLGFDLVFIIGKFGTGKSYGMKSLVPGEYIWFNADRKNPTWKTTELQKKLYGSFRNPGLLTSIPTTYNDIIDKVLKVKNCVNTPDFSICLGNNPVAFLLAHPEEYKGPNNEIYERLKTLGKATTKMMLEGRSGNTLKSTVEIVNEKVAYKLHTQSSGYDTTRSVEGLFPPVIENDYQFILDKIHENLNQ